ncbi:MAG: hypothetical protein KME13_07035 [Myxacorys californica WJT36-NPBG1]|jgi:hypothetical protein|nr:hypothetical protein [Myxacorys californica WJT36-NPBG1]
MYLTPRSAQVRNLSTAAVNGTITLIILLIAPLGLAAVIINTLLVTIASYVTATAADRIVRYLMTDSQQIELLRTTRSQLQRRTEFDRNDIDRR